MLGTKNKKREFGKALYTVEEYLEIESYADDANEFWDGNAVKKPAPDNFHTEVILKFSKLLSEKLSKRNFYVFSNLYSKNKRVFIESKNSFFYPDLFVVGKNIEFYQNREDIITNRILVAEVSTFASIRTLVVDRAEKFWCYQELKSLKEYVLITDCFWRYTIEQYNRIDDKHWKYKSNAKEENGLVTFESIEVDLPVTEFI